MKDMTENNEIKPKIGEYWYVDTGYLTDLIYIGRIIGIKNDKYIVMITNSNITQIFPDKMLCKWQPNRFWKMLGYK